MNQVGELVFFVSGVIVVLMMVLRRQGLDAKQRNAVATAAFGLFLCGRYAALVDGVPNWIFVIAIAGMMVMLAYNNLGFGKAEPAAAG